MIEHFIQVKITQSHVTAQGSSVLQTRQVLPKHPQTGRSLPYTSLFIVVLEIKSRASGLPGKLHPPALCLYLKNKKTHTFQGPNCDYYVGISREDQVTFTCHSP